MQYGEKLTVTVKEPSFEIQAILIHEGTNILYVEDLGHKRVIPKKRITKIENGWK